MQTIRTIAWAFAPLLLALALLGGMVWARGMEPMPERPRPTTTTLG